MSKSNARPMTIDEVIAHYTPLVQLYAELMHEQEKAQQSKRDAGQEQ